MATVATLIVQIGADIADLKRNSEKVDSTLGGIEKTAVSMGKTLAGAFTVGAITAWSMKAIDAAGRIDDLSKKLGVSTDAIQGWEHAAKMGGSSIETVDKAVSFMNKTLAGGSSSTVAALNDAGLKFSSIRAMKPEDAFETIAEAIGKIEDPMIRARVAMALFGKSGQELLPAMVDSFIKARGEAAKMSDDTVRNLAEAGDEIDRWGLKLTGMWGGLLSHLRKDWDGFWGKLTGPVKLLSGAMDTELAVSVDGLVKSFKKQEEATMGSKDSIEAAMAALAEFDAANKDNEAQMKKSWAATDAYNAKLREMADVMTGKNLAGTVRDIAAAVKLAGGASNLTSYEYAQLGKKLDDLKAQGAALTPELHNIWIEHERLNPSIKVTAATAENVARTLTLVKGASIDTAKPVSILALEFERLISNDPYAILSRIPGALGPLKPGLDEATEAAIRLREALKMANALHDASDLIGAFADNIVAHFSKAGAAALNVASDVASMAASFKEGDWVGGAIKGMTLIGQAIAKIFGSEGRDMVKEFAASMGGFDALREKLLPLGDIGEKLWINLTQGVGKNNPEQAKAAIEAITKALQEQQGFIEGMVPSWQDSLALAEKYGIEVGGLGDKFRQAQLAETANTIAVDFRKLIAAGADMNAVLVGMQDEVQGVVTSALKMGLEIPDSMKPIIQKMIEMGTLTDENGNKLTDMSKLNFSETLSKSVERIIDALDRLIAKLGGVVEETTKIPKKIEVGVGWKYDPFTPQGAGGSGGSGAQQFHNGGIIKAHNGMNKILPFAGEVPIIAQTGEAVLNRRAVARLGESGVAGLNGSGGAQVINLGEVVAAINAQRADARRAAMLAPAQNARAVRDALLLAR